MCPSSLLAKVATVTFVVVAVVVMLFSQSRPLVMQKHLLSRSSGRDKTRSSGWSDECSNATPARSENGPMFLFVIGIEGVGHHLFSTIYKNSIYAKRLEEEGIRPTVGNAQQLLYGNGGLMTLHCLDQSSSKIIISDQSPVAKCPRSDSVCLHREVVKALRSVSTKVGNSSLVIPINANGSGQTMGSYPNNKHPCRSLEYPNLDFFYDACKEAGVECGHVYLYRDPMDVLKSTMKRRFNTGPAQAMQLYTTMLEIIFAQLTKYSSSNFGCFGFYDKNVSQEEKWGPLGDLLGWTNRTEFLVFMGKLYRPPAQVPDNKRKSLVPAKELRYLDAFVRAHREVLELCRSTAAARILSQSQGGC